MTSPTKCPCSMIPSNVKVIKVGDSDVGIVDLEKIFREIYFLEIEDEAIKREKLLERIKTNNYVPVERENLYAEALLREYGSFVERRYIARKASPQQSKQDAPGFLEFLRKLAGRKSRKK